MKTHARMTISALRKAFSEGADLHAFYETLHDRIAGSDSAVWTYRFSKAALIARVESLPAYDVGRTPLLGIPFAVKDNIDIADVPTTAACPDFAYVPDASAAVVQQLEAAGAVCVGKTNMDQFATGLVGTRSPLGVPKNPLGEDLIPGGSSSGSACAVSQGLAAFTLGTDTAGSGRVPAAFQNLIGLKPSRGLVSTRGVLPACRTLDCVSVFAHTLNDAESVLACIAQFDAEDPFSRVFDFKYILDASPIVGVPEPEQLQFFGNADYAAAWEQTLERLRTMGVRIECVDCSPFLSAARLLYEGPWVAERLAAIKPFLNRQPASLMPVTRSIIESGSDHSAVDAFQAMYRLAGFKRESEFIWERIQILLLPTTGTTYTLSEVAADPVQTNTNLGTYTNFMNLLDLCAVATPGAWTRAGRPFGVTWAMPTGGDSALLGWLDRLDFSADARIRFCVCGAHMQGLPLNRQLLDGQSTFICEACTAPSYRMFLLEEPKPIRPGVILDEENGSAIDVEVWEMPAAQFGSFVAGIPAPLSIGKVKLEDGTEIPGFLCQQTAVAGCKELTSLGGWRNYLDTQRA